MAEEAFEVMISDEEYKILKGHQKTNQKLNLENDDLKAKVRNAQNHSQQMQLELQKKELEIAFIVDAVQNFASRGAFSNEGDTSVQKSNTFQVLGQSVLEPQKVNQRKISQHNQELSKKYAPLLKQIVQIEERIESQDELISKLNQMNMQKNETLLNRESQAAKEEMQNIKNLENKILELSCQMKVLKAENEEHKRQKIQQKLLLEKQVSNVEKQSEKLLNQTQKELQNIKKENELTAKRIKDCNQRIQDLQMENSVLKQGLGTSNFQKQETRHKIKGLIDQYVRQIEKNLKIIEGLSENERKDLISHELQDIVDYIPKSISNRK